MKNLKIFTCLLAATLFFASCSDDDDDDNKLKFDKDTVEVFVGAEDAVVVTATNAAEGVLTIVADKKTVLAVASEDSDNKIEITGVAEGETTVTVTDKAGKIGTIKVTVLDPSTRFAWNETSVKGEEDYTLVQDAETGKVTFTWRTEADAHPIVLSFVDEGKKLEAGSKKDAKLSIGGEDVAVSALEIKYNREVEEDANPTIWISFKADSKDGVCVATVTVDEELTPEAAE